MKFVESFNSSYPLAYYEVGSVYSFYGNPLNNSVPSSDEDIHKYSSVLHEFIVDEQSNAIKPVGASTSSVNHFGGIHRFYAVVVNKVRNISGAYIVVMFCNRHNGVISYHTKKFAVDYGCDSDGKEWILPSTCLDIDIKNDGNVGGITLAKKDMRVGGITYVGKENHDDTQNYNKDADALASETAVGRITRVDSSKSNHFTDDSISNQIGRITRAEKDDGIENNRVGRITRANVTAQNP